MVLKRLDSIQITLAPLRASSNAKPAPIPRDAPMTIATLSWRGSAVELEWDVMIYGC